jgi:predicted PurR-regulated permease PerM
MGVDTGSSTVDTQALISVVTVVVDAIVSVLVYFFPVLIMCLFFLTEGALLFQRAEAGLPNNPVLIRLATFGTSVARQFGVRAVVNAITGAGFAILLLLLGVDYAVLWGVLTFFLSYIPYIGIVVAGAPAVILAFAEYGLSRALMVVLALTLVNVSAENLLAPSLMGRGLNVSTTVTFIGFIFWVWLFGAPGAFLAMPLTLLAILLLDSFPETRWLANIAMRSPDAVPTAQVAEKPLSTSPALGKRRK